MDSILSTEKYLDHLISAFDRLVYLIVMGKCLAFSAGLKASGGQLADQASRANRCQKSGKDLPTQVSPVIRTPGTFRPATAKLIAIRWSL